MPTCPHCPGRLVDHFVLEARAMRRWRGKSFEADAAMGEVGAALMRALGLSPKRADDFAAFQRHVRVQVVRPQALPANPEAPFDPAQGEDYEFHVALLMESEAGKSEALARAALEALARAGGFSQARLRATV